MKVIIAGSRTLGRDSRGNQSLDTSIVQKAVEASGFEVTEVFSGVARGIDLLGERWAWEHGIPVRRFPADWTRHGKAAGFIRNREMALAAEALIAIWDMNMSKGTGHMIDFARAKGLKVYVQMAHNPAAVQ